jgi:hypothetical protein
MPERRRYPRFNAWLPLRLISVAGKMEPAGETLLTQNVSKTGVCFPARRRIEPGQFIKVEVTLLGGGPAGNDVRVSAEGYIVRAEAGDEPGWYNLAAAFGEPPPGAQPGWHKLTPEF